MQETLPYTSTEQSPNERAPLECLLHDGRKLSYAEYGDPNGKPMLYFHGWPGSRLGAEETDTAAKKIGVRVVSIDRPGYGLSSYQEERTLLDWPNDVIELVDQLTIPHFSVMGVSGGAPYAIACAYKIPDRIATVGIVSGFALMKDNAEQFPFLQNPVVTAFQEMMRYKYFPFLISHIFQGGDDQQVLKANGNSKKLATGFQEAFRQGIKGPKLDLQIYLNDWGFDLHTIHVPVYLWYGDEDRNVPLSMGGYYESHLPNSILYKESGRGHLFRKEQEEKILRQLFA